MNPFKELSELIKEFIMIAGHNIDIQKSTLFLSSNNELSENEN